MSSSRALVWFSCGAASAIAAKLALHVYGDACQVLYCDTFAYEHPDNRRFFADVQRWLDHPITVLRSEKYTDIYDVFEKTGYLVGDKGARCTTELKKVVRHNYEKPDDLHIFGFTTEETQRAADFTERNFGMYCDFILQRWGVTRALCYHYLQRAGIELPYMYKLGYKNNNCIGCVKGGMGYWNKIRRDFPHYFEKMAQTERAMQRTILKDRRGKKNVRLYLDELEPGRGRYEDEHEIECGVGCNVS